MIGIINYGMGNLGSVKNALDYLGIESRIIADPAELAAADKLILPGVGAFGMAMDNLNASGFSETIKELVQVKQKPLLGICLGMQLLLESSTEHGNHTGLGLVKGTVNFFGDAIRGMPIPHMGWNDVTHREDATLYKGIEQNAAYYFVHSYFCRLDNENEVAGTTQYGINFHSSIETGNIFGCQFHPEKSQGSGLAIFRNFNAI